MKFKNVYKLFTLAFLAFLFQSRSSGPAGVAGLQVSGAPSNGTCANTGCHSSGSFQPSLDIELLDGGEVVEAYEPGKTYSIIVTVTPGTGTPSLYGYQTTSRDADNQLSGVLDAGSAQQVVSIGGNDYLEHATPSGSGVFESSWTAPGAGAGAVTFYAAGIAANGNGGNSGDGTAVNTLSIDEEATSSVSFVNRDYAVMEVVPNPVFDVLQMNITSRSAGNFELFLIDASGKVVQREAVSLNSGLNQRSFSVSDLENGFYAVQLHGAQHISAVQMIKL